MKSCYTKIRCHICEQEISLPNYNKHLRRHQKEKGSTKTSYKLNHLGLTCQYCGTVWKNRNSLCNHERQCRSNPNRQVFDAFCNHSRISPLKGKHLTIEHREKIRNVLKGRPKEYTHEQICNMNKKIFETKKKNGTLNSSKVEIYSFQKLKEKYGENNVKHHYKDKRYPYECDFYIASADLFIELNLHWTHGGRLFDYNDMCCLNKLKQWEQKSLNSKYFQNAIKT